MHVRGVVSLLFASKSGYVSTLVAPVKEPALQALILKVDLANPLMCDTI